jgi:hypothetical protein
MAARENALPRAEFDAIVAEATELADKQPRPEIVPLPASWRTLTRDKLAAMLLMPAFGQIPKGPRGLLTDQAATWDMFDFTRPSDAAVLWNRLWPPGDNLQPNHGGSLYEPDPTWSPTSVAMLAVFSCFPSVVWSAPDDPQAWARKMNLGWQWGNYQQTWDGMRLCLPDSTRYWESKAAASVVVKQVAAVLTRKFSDELISDGCSRSGSDDCLVLLQALYGLDNKNAQLPDLLKRIEPSFEWDKPAEITAIDANADRALFDAQRTAVVRQLSFLALKLPVLLKHPGAWPSGELGRTARQVMNTTLAATRLRGFHRFDAMFNQIGVDFINPWQWLEPTQESSIAADMRKLGTDYAAQVGCELARLDEGQSSPSFWQGYIVENIRLGHGYCDSMQGLWLSSLTTSDRATRERSIAALQPIAAELTTEGAFRQLALDGAAAGCKGRKSGAPDPFNLCAGVAARAAAEAARQSPVDPFECGSDVVAAAEEALNVTGREVFLRACRLHPSHKGYAIVALTYPPVSEKTDNASSANGPSAYDLELAVFDLVEGNVVSHAYQSAAIPTDAIRFDSLTIDTGRYILAPGKRAFGIRTTHSAHCYGCIYEAEELDLYLPDGQRLSKILGTVVTESSADPHDQCPDGSSTRRTTLSVGGGQNHGLADLLLSTANTFSCNDEDTQSEQPGSASTLVLHFDGHTYPMPVP